VTQSRDFAAARECRHRETDRVDVARSSERRDDVRAAAGETLLHERHQQQHEGE